MSYFPKISLIPSSHTSSREWTEDQLNQKANTSFPCPGRGPRTIANQSELPGIVRSGATREKTLFFLHSGEAVSPELRLHAPFMPGRPPNRGKNWPTY